MTTRQTTRQTTRRSKFTEDQILDAALRLVATGGPAAATIGAIAELLGAPSGSIYYRFASRDLLLAQLWMRTIKRFQAGFLAALAHDDLEEAALGAALHVVRWEREHADEARVMLLFRREDLAARWPQELGDELATLNREVQAAMADYAQRRYGEASAEAVQRVYFALAEVPYSAGRRYLLAGEAPPPIADELVTTTVRCVLGLPPSPSA